MNGIDPAHARKAAAFVDALAAEMPGKDAFNPYSDRCMKHDAGHWSPALRAEQLEQLLSAAEGADLWIGREPGWRGARRSGVALMDDKTAGYLFRGFGLDWISPVKEHLGEATAGFVWKAAKGRRVFPWNACPFHCHEPDEPFTNRAHSRELGETGLWYLMRVSEIVRPRVCVAIGNDAALALAKVNPPGRHFKVRHPSYGGAKDFAAQIAEIYS